MTIHPSILDNSRFFSLLRVSASIIYSSNKYPPKMLVNLLPLLAELIGEKSKIVEDKEDKRLINLGKSKNLLVLAFRDDPIQKFGVMIPGDPQECLTDVKEIWIFVCEDNVVELLMFDPIKLSDFVAEKAKAKLIKEKNGRFFLGETELFRLDLESQRVIFKWPLLKVSLISKRRIADLTKNYTRNYPYSYSEMLRYLIEGLYQSLLLGERKISI